MVKKGDLHEKLAAGKALNKALKETKAKTAASEAAAPEPEIKVPLNAKLPGGMTLKGYMAKHGLSYSEAATVYEAFTSYSMEEDAKLKARQANHGDGPEEETTARPVATPARAVPKGKEKPVEEEPSGSAESSKASKKKVSKAPKRKALEEEAEATAEEPSAETSCKAAKAKKATPSSKPPKKTPSEAEQPAVVDAAPLTSEPGSSVKKKLRYAAAFSSDEEVAEVAPKKFRRVNAKRGLTPSETKAMKETTEAGTKEPPQKKAKAKVTFKEEPEEPQECEEPEEFEGSREPKITRKGATILESPNGSEVSRPSALKRSVCLG